jgi:predicted protein tyrosine phosphatase
MKIQICSHEAAAALLLRKPHALDVVLIANPGARYDNEETLNAIRSNAKGLCELAFDDIEAPREHFSMPEAHHIQTALDFAADKDQLLVTCTAGKSRSAALSYVLACSKMKPSEAVLVLDPSRHTPNQRVIVLGYNLLGRPPGYLEAYYSKCHRRRKRRRRR